MTGSPAHPTKSFFLVEWASCPFQNLIKRTFARGLFCKLPAMNIQLVDSLIQVIESLTPEESLGVA
ncbi:hypothetical protein QUB70_01015 [Microcoleus sp. A003_D6]